MTPYIRITPKGSSRNYSIQDNILGVNNCLCIKQFSASIGKRCWILDAGCWVRMQHAIPHVAPCTPANWHLVWNLLKNEHRTSNVERTGSEGSNIEWKNKCKRLNVFFDQISRFVGRWRRWTLTPDTNYSSHSMVIIFSFSRTLSSRSPVSNAQFRILANAAAKESE